MRTRLAAVLVAGLLLATAACGGGSKDTASTSTTRSSTTTTGTIETTTTGGATTTSGPTTTTTVACPPPAGASTDPQSTPAPSDPALLTNVEAHRDGCHDVVTFTFRTAAPGATAKYVSGPITQDGSGAVVNVPGNAHLVIRMEPAAATDIVGGGTPTYNGPKAFAPAGARAVQGLVFTGDFEGVVTWVVGLSTQVPFTMSSSGNSLSISL